MSDSFLFKVVLDRKNCGYISKVIFTVFLF